MGAWSEHGSSTGGYYKCNRFQSTGSTDQCSIAKAKAELERYLHYYQRFHAHEQSGRCAHRQKESIQKRSLEEHSVEHLLQAVELVVDCRRVLGYSYVLGYYLSDDSEERGLFEHHQEMLEKNTEK
jgi:ariadne-1